MVVEYPQLVAWLESDSVESVGMKNGVLRSTAWLFQPLLLWIMEAGLLMKCRALVRPDLVDGRGDALVLKKGFLGFGSLDKFLLNLISYVHQGLVSFEVLVTHVVSDLGLEVLDNHPQLLFLRILSTI